MTVTMDWTAELEVVEVTGCGHTIYMTTLHQRELMRTHNTFFCTYCGKKNYYAGKSDVEKLRGQLASTKDMLDTARADRDRKEYQRRAEKAAKTRIKNRVQNGVCPCCKRTFQDLARHMAGQHPDFAAS